MGLSSFEICFNVEAFVHFGCVQESKFLKFLGFMWNPLSWVMEAAAIMAIALANGGVRTSSFVSLNNLSFTYVVS